MDLAAIARHVIRSADAEAKIADLFELDGAYVAEGDRALSLQSLSPTR